MSSLLIDDAQRLEALDSLDDLWRDFQQTLLAFGIKHYIYLTVAQDKSAPFLSSSLDLHGPIQSTELFDPFLDYCCQNYQITCTGSEFLDDYPYLDEASRQFITDASKLGFTAGLGIPMRLTGSDRYGGFNVGTDMTRQEFVEKILPLAENLRLLCLIVHRRAEELHSDEAHLQPEDGFRRRLVAGEVNVLSRLSPREKEVAYLVSRGFTRGQTAKSCQIAEPTVSTHLKHVYRKLNITSNAELTRLIVESE